MGNRHIWIGLLFVGICIAIGVGIGYVNMPGPKQPAPTASFQADSGLPAPQTGPTVSPIPSPQPSPTSVAAIDPLTQTLPKVGECFSTSVDETGGRLEGDLTSGTSVLFADGHMMVDYDQRVDVQAWRKGDPVKLCVTDLPENCPPGDNRGVGYSALNLRIGEQWAASDSEHMCGGA